LLTEKRSKERLPSDVDVDDGVYEGEIGKKCWVPVVGRQGGGRQSENVSLTACGLRPNDLSQRFQFVDAVNIERSWKMKVKEVFETPASGDHPSCMYLDHLATSLLIFIFCWLRGRPDFSPGALKSCARDQGRDPSRSYESSLQLVRAKRPSRVILLELKEQVDAKARFRRTVWIRSRRGEVGEVNSAAIAMR
jgi:hypothetical protein